MDRLRLPRVGSSAPSEKDRLASALRARSPFRTVRLDADRARFWPGVDSVFSGPRLPCRGPLFLGGVVLRKIPIATDRRKPAWPLQHVKRFFDILNRLFYPSFVFCWLTAGARWRRPGWILSHTGE
jgi:hypothetical protein